MGELYNSIYILSSFTLNRIHILYVRTMYIRARGYKWKICLFIRDPTLGVYLNYIFMDAVMR